MILYFFSKTFKYSFIQFQHKKCNKTKQNQNQKEVHAYIKIKLTNTKSCVEKLLALSLRQRGWNHSKSEWQRPNFSLVWFLMAPASSPEEHRQHVHHHHHLNDSVTLTAKGELFSRDRGEIGIRFSFRTKEGKHKLLH